MTQENFQLDISKLTQRSYANESAKSINPSTTIQPRQMISNLFKDFPNVKRLSLSNKRIIDSSGTLIKCTLTREKINITVQTSIKIITFDYLINENKCFINSKESTQKQFEYFVKAMNNVINFSNHENVIINTS